MAKKTTDQETMRLLSLIKEGDGDAFGILSEKYRTVIGSAAVSAQRRLSSMGKTSLAEDDLEQEARVALYRAAVTYESAMADKVTFGLYAKICIRNAMISLIRRESALMRRSIRAEKRETFSPDVSGRISDAMELAALLENGRTSLSEYESAVLDEYISGKPAREIAKDMGETPKSVSNAIYRIKVKLRRAATGRASSGK